MSTRRFIILNVLNKHFVHTKATLKNVYILFDKISNQVPSVLKIKKLAMFQMINNRYIFQSEDKNI